MRWESRPSVPIEPPRGGSRPFVPVRWASAIGFFPSAGLRSRLHFGDVLRPAVSTGLADRLGCLGKRGTVYKSGSEFLQ